MEELDSKLTGSTLEDFERPVPTKPMRPLEWSIEKYQVAQLLGAKGMTVARVSEVTGVPISAINRWKQHPDFAKYIRDFILEEAENLRAYRLSLCLKMLDARVAKIEELGDYSILSTKDTLDILETMRKDTEKAEDKEQSQYMKTLEVLITKSKQPLQLDSGGK